MGVIYQPPFLDCSYRDLVEKRVKKIMAEFDRSTEQAGGFVAIREGLSRRGHSPQSLMKICWSNFMRVFQSVSTRREG